jgi:hypothetical protein
MAGIAVRRIREGRSSNGTERYGHREDRDCTLRPRHIGFLLADPFWVTG